MSLHGKHIVLGLTGSVAAYKAVFLLRKLQKAGAEVRVLLTSAAQQFVTPLTFQSLCGEPPITDIFTPDEHNGMRHIELARWADLLLVAPASANILGKMANGIGDDVISTTYLACSVPTAVAPAMNRNMWEHPATRRNIEILKSCGVHVWEPAVGIQACGDEGAGRMLEPDELMKKTSALFAERVLKNSRVVITAGPTHEYIDEVRYLGNLSSGKMGFAMARAAAELGADTTLISGPVALETPPGVNRLDVVSARQMHDTVIENIPACDIFIACAAVADYRPTTFQSGKIKKTEMRLQLPIERTEDILDTVARLPERPFLVGFSAETSEVLANAKAKLLKKGIDMIVANQVGINAPYGFDADQNEVTAIWHGGEQAFAPELKSALGGNLLKLIVEHYQARGIYDVANHQT